MKKNNKGFSVLLSILIIGFLMVLTLGTFNLVLRELHDSKGAFDYLKAYSAAEGAGEMALLDIKEKGYGYYVKVDNDVNDYSVILSDNPIDSSKFIKAKEAILSYDLNSKVKEYNGNLKTAKFDIIPLFYIDKSGAEHKVTKLELNVTLGDSSKLTRNILGKDFGISGISDFTSSTKGKGRFLVGTNYEFQEKKIGSFLSSSTSNYLILMNIGSSDITYDLKSTGDFTLPRTDILATGRVGKYKQNLNIHLDNTEYLGRSRYSIYGN